MSLRIAINFFVFTVVAITAAVILSVFTDYHAYPVPAPQTTQSILEERYKVAWPESELLALAIDRAVATHGGTAELTMAQIAIESSFKPRTSKAGAVGFMQVRPKFWHKSEECPYNVYDKYENVFAGVCILQHYKVKYGNIEDALVAYNIGPGTLGTGPQYRTRVLKEAERAE